MTVRYKKKKAQLHLRSVNPRQHTASSRKTRLPNAEGEAAPPPPHVNGSPSGLRRCHWKPVRLATSKWFPHQIFSWSFEFFDWPAVTTRCSTKERERDRERQSKRESASTHRSQRPLPPHWSEPSRTHRERDNTPPPLPHQEEKRKTLPLAHGRGHRHGLWGEERFRGPAGAGPAETRGQRWARPSRGQTCSCGCRCGDQAGNYRGRFYVRRSLGSWSWAERATGSGCCGSCWGLMSPLQRQGTEGH